MKIRTNGQTKTEPVRDRDMFRNMQIHKEGIGVEKCGYTNSSNKSCSSENFVGVAFA